MKKGDGIGIVHNQLELGIALDLNGPSMIELREATALLTQKYGAYVSFLVDIEEEAMDAVTAFFMVRKIRVRRVPASSMHKMSILHCENGAL